MDHQGHHWISCDVSRHRLSAGNTLQMLALLLQSKMSSSDSYDELKLKNDGIIMDTLGVVMQHKGSSDGCNCAINGDLC